MCIVVVVFIVLKYEYVNIVYVFVIVLFCFVEFGVFDFRLNEQFAQQIIVFKIKNVSLGFCL